MYATSLTTLPVGCARGLRYPVCGGAGLGHAIPWNWGPGLSPQDSQLPFESTARLNEAEPVKVGRSEAWSNPQTSSSGTSTILRIFHSGGMVCHRLRHHIIIAGQQPGHDYRLTWCRTSTGEWKSKG